MARAELAYCWVWPRWSPAIRHSGRSGRSHRRVPSHACPPGSAARCGPWLHRPAGCAGGRRCARHLPPAARGASILRIRLACASWPDARRQAEHLLGTPGRKFGLALQLVRTRWPWGSRARSCGARFLHHRFECFGRRRVRTHVFNGHRRGRDRCGTGIARDCIVADGEPRAGSWQSGASSQSLRAPLWGPRAADTTFRPPPSLLGDKAGALRRCARARCPSPRRGLAATKMIAKG